MSREKLSKEDLTWEEWSEELVKVAERIVPGAYGSEGPVKAYGEDAWRGMYNNGYSPYDALHEDMTYWD
jgi:hypothetical protein